MEQNNLFEKPASFEARFLETLLGPMIKNPLIAVTELVANSYDAGAKNVYITWPTSSEFADAKFEIQDDGVGLSEEKFSEIWSKINYDRLKNQKNIINVRDDNGNVIEKRTVYGKNGKGRLSGFCFNNHYYVTSSNDSKTFTYKVEKSLNNTSPFSLIHIDTSTIKSDSNISSGLKISTEIKNTKSLIEIDTLKEELGSRFISSPTFSIFINNKKLALTDLNKNFIHEAEIIFKGYKILLKLIECHKSDTSTRQHGIAWWVNKRLVGPVDWNMVDDIDGRRTVAKKYNLIIEANCLDDLGLVKSDWNSFKQNEPLWVELQDIIIPKINEMIETEERKKSRAKSNKILGSIFYETQELGRISREKVTKFIDTITLECPSLTNQTLVNLANILVNLEKSNSKYSLIQNLASTSPEQLDKLNSIVNNWGIDMAKIVLDEIESRLKTITQFEERVKIPGVKEVQDLQTLFNNGLWMFGASFESIEYSSNKAMTRVIKEVFKKNIKGSLNRPDYVIKEDDSTLGLYSTPKYDDETHDEIGTDKLVIVDLKTTGLHVGSQEKDQIWKYVKELEKFGAITKNTRVYGFILGDRIESGENSARKEWDGRVSIEPLLYNSLLGRAKNRMLKLSEKVSSAPVLQHYLKEENERLDSIYPYQRSLA
ncbi:ATP-binding protein [Acinetobacter sp. B5B]|uniref:ATP-binding protein n=1 Tax=Acinetobacter baretiae TaxID=2605383 RepID=UPI0018C214DA|nr:ATP-binding protein [Acinetobacter baretiae]MBF7683010.1 ATP-binding protein [Acinetobacter baretiae]